MKDLDLITIGRSSVDLYGGQVGGRLEDMRSFDKYVGGSPTNMAVGTARLGMKSALITRVGDEHMGRFLLEELAREGVETAGIVTDPERLTALVILGIRDQEQFPLIFYRDNCADMALSVEDIDPAFIARARAVVATGTHLSNPQTEAAVLRALILAREGGARTALDIDYRPNLWGLSGHGDGENRFIASERVTEKLQSMLPLFDLIVGRRRSFISRAARPTRLPRSSGCGSYRPRRSSASGGRWGRSPSPARSGTTWMRARPARASRSTYSTFWVPGTASCRAS